MSAELLRKAASEMRRKAEAATPGPWSVVPGASNVWRFPDEGAPTLVVNGVGGNAPSRPKQAARMPDAAHIASWHPTAALAVADWLEAKAEQDNKGTCDDPRGCCNLCEHDYGHVAALAVARAYLGEQP